MSERPAIHKPAPVLDHGERHIGRSTCRSVPCAHGRSFVARLSKWQVGEHFRLAVEHERGGFGEFMTKLTERLGWQAFPNRGGKPW